MMEVIFCILKVAVEFYLLLSLIYILLYLPENLAFQWRHAKNNFTHKVSGILLTLGLSLVFGGISLAQKVKTYAKKKYQTYRTWYHLAKTANELTKTLRDALDDEKEES